MSNLTKIKILLGIDINDTSKDNLLMLYLDAAESEFIQYCHIDEVPAAASNIITDMAVIKYNLNGSEGLGSQSYSGLNETYDNYPPQLIKAMNRFRRVVAL